MIVTIVTIAVTDAAAPVTAAQEPLTYVSNWLKLHILCLIQPPSGVTGAASLRSGYFGGCLTKLGTNDLHEAIFWF